MSRKYKYVSLDELLDIAKTLNDGQKRKEFVIVDAEEIIPVRDFIFAISADGVLVAFDYDSKKSYLISGRSIASSDGETIIDSVPFFMEKNK